MTRDRRGARNFQRDDILYPISFDAAGAKQQMRVFFDAAEMQAKGTPPGELRLLKNAHLRRFPHPSSLRRTFKYSSLLRISGALHLGIFEQPEKNDFFSKLLKGIIKDRSNKARSRQEQIDCTVTG